MMPPATPRLGLGRMCRLTMFTFCTSTYSSSSTRMIVPRLPLSLPAVTTTSSSFLIFLMPALRAALPSQYFRRKRNDLHELLTAQLTRHRAKNARADRLLLVVEQHCGVRIEANDRAVRTPNALAG